MTLRTIVEEMARKRGLEYLIRSIGNPVGENCDDMDDLAQELYMYLLTRDEEKILEKYNSGPVNWKNYLIKMITNQMFSGSSGYYRKYKKYTWAKRYDDNYGNDGGGGEETKTPEEEVEATEGE